MASEFALSFLEYVYPLPEAACTHTKQSLCPLWNMNLLQQAQQTAVALMKSMVSPHSILDAQNLRAGSEELTTCPPRAGHSQSLPPL